MQSSMNDDEENYRRKEMMFVKELEIKKEEGRENKLCQVLVQDDQSDVVISHDAQNNYKLHTPFCSKNMSNSHNTKRHR